MSDAHLWDTWVIRADSDSPGPRQGGSQTSEYVLLNGGTQTFSPTVSSLSAQPLLLCSQCGETGITPVILLYSLLYLLLDWYLSSRLLCWGLVISLRARNSFPGSDYVVFPYFHELCPLSIEVSWIVLYRISCHTPCVMWASCYHVWMCGFAQCSVNSGWSMRKDSFSPHLWGWKAHFINITILYCNSNLLFLLDREREERFFCWGNPVGQCCTSGNCWFRWVSGETGVARAQIPILFCAKVIHFVLGPADVASSFWTWKVFCASGRWNNTNGCITEVTLDFHTDRFSFFFFLSLMRFQERVGEGGW